MIQNNGHVCLLWVYVIKKEYINNYHTLKMNLNKLQTYYPMKNVDLNDDN